MADTVTTVLGFIVALIVSTIVIWVVTKLFGEKEGIGTALIAAIIGTIIYTIAYWLLGDGTLASIIGGIVWLLALKGLYKIGWLRPGDRHRHLAADMAGGALPAHIDRAPLMGPFKPLLFSNAAVERRHRFPAEERGRPA